MFRKKRNNDVLVPCDEYDLSLEEFICSYPKVTVDLNEPLRRKYLALKVYDEKNRLGEFC